jgi:hypothetical protein
MTVVAVAALLVGVLLAIVAAMVWQAVRTVPDATPTYVVEEVVPFAYQELSEGAASRLDHEDVQRILEWEVYYLQGLAAASEGDEPIVAGSDEAVVFIEERTRSRGYQYRRDDIDEVLGLEAVYLAEIGAVGPIVDDTAPVEPS